MRLTIPVLYYHYIKKPTPDTRIKGLYTTASQLEWQIELLIRKGFNFITFRDIIDKKYNQGEKNIILTFDDGCETVYHNAFPILKKFNIRAVVFIVGDCIEKRNVIWPENENNEAINTLSHQQIREMDAYGIEIGSHALSHRHLTKLESGTVVKELTESKRILEDIIEKEVISIAYPFGSYNSNTIALTKAAGYEFGVTTAPGNNLAVSDFEIQRYSIKGNKLHHYWYFIKMINRISK